jgi:parallel beta-helix repeat protein
VPNGITLTILPGTEIIVDTGCSIDVKGNLNIQNSSVVVTFRSSSGLPNSWKGIYLEGQATLNGVTIQDAERGLTVVSGATATLTNCIFQNNLVGLHVYGTTPTVSKCSFLNNTIYGIKEDENGRPVLTECIFSGNGINYYSEIDTELTIEELNKVPGNGGNR